jgi:arylsulfatase A-like enzyme
VLALAGLALGVLVAAPARAFPGFPPERLDRTDDDAARAPAPRTVLLVSVDGLAPWVVEGTETPALDAFARRGLAARRAETVVPSVTLPSHASMIAGVGPEQHGVDWNRWLPWRSVEAPTVFTHCRRAGLRCGLFAGKSKLAHFATGEAGVERYGLGEDAEAVMERAEAYLEERDPHFVMIHLAEVDRTGHREGWGSEAQRAVVRRLDAALGEFVEELEDETERPLTWIVTADHGGHGTRHGSDDPRDVRIPWIAWGDGVPAGARLDHVHTLDTGPTVLRLLGLSVPEAWAGRARLPLAADRIAAEPDDRGSSADASGGGE